MQIRDIQIDENNKETTLHGSNEFPVAIYLDQLNNNVLGFVNWHWHNEIQLALVTQGDVKFCVNQTAYTVKQGQGIFINSGCLHMAAPVSDPASTYICINADPKLLTFFPGSAIEQKYVNPFLKDGGFSAILLTATDWQQTVIGQIQDIYTLYTQKAYGYELDICLALADIWRLLTKKQSKAAANGNDSAYIEQQRQKNIMAYIHDHYAEGITLPAIAAAVNLSQGECCRFFKRMMKCTLFEYILNCRINKSMELLQTTDLTVSQIADFAGFGSTSYFIERFKKRTACTPKEYRNNRRGDLK